MKEIEWKITFDDSLSKSDVRVRMVEFYHMQYVLDYKMSLSEWNTYSHVSCRRQRGRRYRD